MCGPLIGPIIGAVASIGGAIISQQAQAAAIDRQRKANEQWAAYQSSKRNQFYRQQDALLEQARRARAAGEDRLREVQTDREGEEERLADEFQEDANQIQENPDQVVSDALLSGQQTGGTIINTELARSLSDAATKSRQKSAALATLQSYGPSQFGFGNNLADIFSDTGQDIDLINNKRVGNRSAYQFVKSVQPGTGGGATTGENIAGALGQGISAFGGRAGGAISAGAPISSMFS